MLKMFSLTGLIAAMTIAGVLAQATTTPVQEPPTPAPLALLDNVRETLQRAANSLSHSANQSCDVKHARAWVKGALDAVNASARFLAAHSDALRLPPLPPAVTPDFAAPPRPAPQRNAMLEGALKNLKTAFQGLSEAPGADLGGYRDRAYQGIDEAAKSLMAGIKAANAAFREGHRELPDCALESGGDPRHDR
jgi:hypothetical protein